MFTSSGFNPMAFFGLGMLGMFTIGFFGLLIALVILYLKGMALWTSARRGEKWWFVALLLINTLGILELVYLIAVAEVWPRKKTATTEPVKPTDPPAPPSTGHIA
jgi:hypothetical protein